MANEIVVTIITDPKPAKKGFDDFKKSGKSAAGEIEKSIEKRVEGSLKNLKVGLAVVGAGFAALTATAAKFISTASRFEAINVQFEVLTKSAAKANQLMKDLQVFSASTPFQFEDIAKASQRLLGFGFAAEEITARLREIGDVASASGQDLAEVALIFGQVEAAGKLTGERLIQFEERAIPIGPAIAKTMGVAESSVRDLISSGQVSAEVFKKAFASISAEGGTAFDGMIKQSRTMAGLWSTLQDNITLVSNSIGQELLPIAKLLTVEFTKILGNILKGFQSGEMQKQIFDVIRSLITVADILASTLLPAAELFFNGFRLLVSLTAGAIQEFLIIPLTAAARVATALGETMGVVSEETATTFRMMNQAAQEALTDINASTQAIADGTFDLDFTDKVQSMIDKVSELSDTIAALAIDAPLNLELMNQSLFSVSDGFKNVFVGMKAAADSFRKNAENNFKATGKAMFNTLGTAAGNAFAAFGKAAASGKNAIEAFLNSLLASFGQMAIQLGTQFILSGIAYSYAGLPNGPPLIAAGAALAVFGGVLSALGGGGGGGAAGGGEGGGTGGGVGAVGGDNVTALPDQTPREPQTSVTVQVNGLVAGDRRAIGQEIADIVSESFRGNGTVITGTA